MIAMPLISQDLPAYTNDNNSGFNPANLANNSNAADYWYAATYPTGGVGAYLAYDISSISNANKTNVVLMWQNDANNNPYDYTVKAATPYLLAVAYTIDANTAIGGSLPSSGWITLVTVTGNVLHSRQHVINLSGYNWVRINITTVSDTGVALNIELHNAANGIQDDYLMLGDSITQYSLNQDNTAPGGTLAQAINRLRPSYFPIAEGGGVSGETSTELSTNLARWLALFPGKYVSLNIGTNDALNSIAPATYQANMISMINAVIAAGCVPMIPTLPYGTQSPIPTNAPTLNTIIYGLYTSYPQILRGPDLWTFFFSNQSLISADGIHPNLAGRGALRNLWAGTLVKALYSPTSAFSRLGVV